MTTSNEQVPEATRLADEWLRETQREVDRRNSAYDHHGMGNTPETLDPLGAKMAAELRRQHAENEALRAGYNAARLEIESLKPQIIPGVQWQCGPLASGFTAPHPATKSQADSQPVPVPRWDEMIRQQFPDMPPKGWSDTLIRRYMTRELDAYRAARAPADSVTTPAVERENLALHRMLCVAHAGAAAYMDDGEAQDSRELPIIDFLRDTPDEIQDKLQKHMLNKLTDGTASKQVDAARHFFDAGWKACANFCDRDDVRFDGIVGHRGCPQFEEAFRAARKQYTDRASHWRAPAQAAPVREEREAFKAAHRHLELDEVPDAWGQPTFKHSHVEASWLGWIARAARKQGGV